MIILKCFLIHCLNWELDRNIPDVWKVFFPIWPIIWDDGAVIFFVLPLWIMLLLFQYYSRSLLVIHFIVERKKQSTSRWWWENLDVLFTIQIFLEQKDAAIITFRTAVVAGAWYFAWQLISFFQWAPKNDIVGLVVCMGTILLPLPITCLHLISAAGR